MNKQERRHIEEFYRLRCAPDVQSAKLFPNVKEITESMAACHAVFRWFPELRRNAPFVRVVSVGDGCTPRTAGLFAFRTAWQCISVDPRLRTEGFHPFVKRLYSYPMRIEDTPLSPTRDPTSDVVTIVVAVHSHADLQVAVDKLEPYGVVAIPCCREQEILGGTRWWYYRAYRDPGIWSPCNQVKIWKKGGS